MLFIFKWLKLRIFNFMTSTRSIRGSFFANSGDHKYFCQVLQIFIVKLRSQKRQKINFSHFENSNLKKRLKLWFKSLGEMLAIKRSVICHHSLFSKFPKLRKLSLKLVLKSRFFMNN